MSGTVIHRGLTRIFRQMPIEQAMPGRWARWISAAEPDWDAVYADQLPRVYNFFRYRFGITADAEDLTARTFEKAWRARHRYRRDLAAFSTWLLSIARNVAADHVRARRPLVPLDEAASVAATGTPEDDAVRHSDGERLATLLQLLPERERELLAMKYGAGMTNRAIALAAGLTESNVGTIVHRAVQTLRQRWGVVPSGPPGDTGGRL
jgi:RNA polymerase sigma-70 factor (ECF subfamily)